MNKGIVVLILLLISLNSQAQKWGLRVSYNRLISYRSLSINSINSMGGNTVISEKFYRVSARNVFLRNYISNIPIQSGFGDISVVYNISKKKSILVGYRSINPYIASSVKVGINSDFGEAKLGLGHAAGISIPTLKLNYSYLLSNPENKKRLKINIYGGILFHFKGADGTFDGGRRGVVGKYYDSNGNIATLGYIFMNDKEFYRPKNPTPYVNLGFDVGISLGKRFKLGMELAAYAGYKTLYTRKYYVETHESQASYEVSIKPYFFSGGIYLQYRIK